MPIYAYRCAACGHAKDVLQKLSDPLLTTCPACGAQAFSKQVTAAGFQLKGSGWYVTDFRGGNQAGKDVSKDAAKDDSPDAKPATAEAGAPAAAGSPAGTPAGSPAPKTAESKPSAAPAAAAPPPAASGA